MNKISSNSSVKEINLKEIILPYIRKWYWFLISGIIGLFIAFLYLKTLTPVFEINSTILIKDAKNNSGGADFSVLKDISGLGKIGTNGVENEIEIFKSKKLMKSVVNDLGIQSIIEIRNKFRSSEVYGNNAPFLIKILQEKKVQETPEFKVVLQGSSLKIQSEKFKEKVVQYGQTVALPFADIMFVPNKNYNPDPVFKSKEFFVNYRTLEGAVDFYLSKLNVTLVKKDATVIKISLNYPETDKAKNIINRLVEVYNIDALQDKNSESKKTAEFIDERIAVIGKELGDVEQHKQQFKQSNAITDIESEVKLGLQSGINAKDKQLELDSQLELNNAMLAYVKNQGSYNVLPLNLGLQDPSAASNIMQYNQLILERNRLLQNATPQNPLVVDITKQLNGIRTSIVQSIQKNSAGLQQARDKYVTEQQKLSGKLSKVPTQERLFRGIERQQQIKENLYLLLLEKREEAQITLAISALKARILDEAYVSGKVSPKPAIILSAGLALALLLPLIFLYITSIFDNKIKNKHDIEQLSGGKPVIGEIPRLKRGDKELVTLNDISPLAESFRILITNLKFTLPNKEGGKIIFVTSTVKGEGKTFVSVNLALTFSSPKLKTIIIGSDIRNPQLARYNEERKSSTGLTDYLHDELTDYRTLIRKNSYHPHLDVLYSGTIPPNPTDLLSNGRFDILLKELQQEYDYIIVDTAPLMLVTDTLLISHLADATIYVTRSEYTDKDLILFASSAVDENKIKNVSFVVNDVSKNHSGYGNRYGYGYQAEEKGFFQKLKDRF